MDRNECKRLIEMAMEAREGAYTPYSDFKVGAAVLADDGEIFTGCNIENASYGATICAERTAFVKAISKGHRSFTALAVVGKKDSYTYPCGICRQFIIEFGKDIKIIVAKTPEDYKVFAIEELLPYGFTGEDF
ncbi:MAG: cytidine deaminase [Clostridiales bacterium]|nr:MAG: cytidine deaminase [Clostridiales bacterium]